ncbi:H(+)-transporting V0 sector ATPase subunit a [Aspergillus niger]|nr:H(+)-transporting V0 sector ATPase subunit a [Aspergillus niger]
MQNRYVRGGPTGYFHSKLDKASIPIPTSSESSDTLEASHQRSASLPNALCLEQQNSSLNNRYETQMKRELELTEWRWVLSEAGSYFDHAYSASEDIRQSLNNDETPLLPHVEQQTGLANDAEAQSEIPDMGIWIIAKVILRVRLGLLPRILRRKLRGNLYMNQSDVSERIIDPISNERSTRMYSLSLHMG